MPGQLPALAQPSVPRQKEYPQAGRSAVENGVRPGRKLEEKTNSLHWVFGKPKKLGLCWSNICTISIGGYLTLTKSGDSYRLNGVINAWARKAKFVSILASSVDRRIQARCNGESGRSRVGCNSQLQPRPLPR